METKKQYWLVTTKDRYCSDCVTLAIAQHPAEYMAQHLNESLVFAMPITKRQFYDYEKAYCG